MPPLKPLRDAATEPQANAFSTYLSARFAAGEHDMPEAARYYSQSLKNDPGQCQLCWRWPSSTPPPRAISTAPANMPTQVVATTPDDRSARLALAVIAFKHKDYAEARKQFVAVGQGTVHRP